MKEENSEKEQQGYLLQDLEVGARFLPCEI